MKMGRLRRICKAAGSMRVKGVLWIWDYVNDEPVKESEMTPERKKESEKARWKILKDSFKFNK